MLVEALKRGAGRVTPETATVFAEAVALYKQSGFLATEQHTSIINQALEIKPAGRRLVFIGSIVMFFGKRHISLLVSLVKKNIAIRHITYISPFNPNKP